MVPQGDQDRPTCLKIRIGGRAARCWRAGRVFQQLPGGDLYPALGVIDAAEWVAPRR
jgi:TRAP-type mannitol/chloroaromatic compound transport system substrate-binding protein